MSHTTINKEIDNLLKEVKIKVESNTDSDLTFGLSIIKTAKKIIPKIQLSEAEQVASETEESKGQLNENVSKFIDLFSKAYFTNKGQSKDWMKSQKNQKDLDFFTGFFDNLDSVDTEFATWFDQGSRIKINEGKESYEKWKNIQVMEDQKIETTKKVNRAIDLKGLLIGVLRMFGLSSFEIRVIMQG
jgi:hypothetical protein